MRSGGWVAGLVTVLYVVSLKSLFFWGGGATDRKRFESTPYGGQTEHHGDDVCGGSCFVV